jgi:hypothetical protein
MLLFSVFCFLEIYVNIKMKKLKKPDRQKAGIATELFNGLLKKVGANIKREERVSAYGTSPLV